MLCPTNTICCKAGSDCPGSQNATASRSEFRISNAELMYGFPVSYWKNQTWKLRLNQGEDRRSFARSTQVARSERRPCTNTIGILPR